MKIERLRNKKSKLIFLCGCLVVVVLLVTVVIKGSKAKYRNSNIIPLINTKVTNKVPSFTTMGIYLETSPDTAGAEEKGGKYYNKQDKNFIIPEGYKINSTNSYCKKFNSTNESIIDNNAKMYTNFSDEHIMYGISEGDKCYIYLDKGFADPTSIKAQLLTKWNYVGKVITERTDLGKVRTDTGNVVYKTQDNDGTSYYLVGNPTNNWVKFGGFYWRIVRINGDGSLRMIYQGRTKDENNIDLLPQITGNETVIGNYKYNNKKDKIEYVGYFYKEGEQRGLEVASNVYGVVNDFYNNNLANVDIDKYIDKNAGFCGDRSANDWRQPSKVYEWINYNSFSRIEGNKFSLYCKEKNDLYTSRLSVKGNKVLENPIGLISADEAGFSGLNSVVDSSISNCFNVGLNYWTMTPSRMYQHHDGLYAYVFVVRSSGLLNGMWNDTSIDVVRNYGVRPVINLVKNITFSHGDGSREHPFEI